MTLVMMVPLDDLQNVIFNPIVKYVFNKILWLTVSKA